MANKFVPFDNADPIADIRGYLASHPTPILPADLIQALNRAQDFLSLLHVEGAKYSRQAALAEIGRREKAARENPTSENIALLAEATPDEILARFDKVSSSIGQQIESFKASEVAPLLLRAHAFTDAFLRKLIDEETATAARRWNAWGLNFDPSRDGVIRSLHHARASFARELSEHPSRSLIAEPDVVRSLLGELIPLTENEPSEKAAA